MYVRRIHLRNRTNPQTYIRVVESVRENGRPVQKTVLNLGRADLWPDERIAKLITLLQEFVGIKPDDPKALTLENVKIEDPRELGPYLPLVKIWDDLKMDAILDKQFEHLKLGSVARDCIKVMVLTRLVKPLSKRAVCEMVRRKAHIPCIDAEALPQHMYYRSLSLLSGVRDEIEKALHQRITDLFNRDVSLVFYDLTSSYFEGTHCKMARRGYSREHRPDLVQIEVGLMVDAEGMPIGHEVFEGNVNDVCTVIGTLERLKKTFGICRCVFISDDGMASKANLQAIADHGYEFITSLSLGRSKIGEELLAAHAPARNWPRIAGSSLVMKVLQKDEGDRTYVGTYNPERAKAARETRKKQFLTCRKGMEELNAPPKLRAKAPTAEVRLKAAQKLLVRCHARAMFNVTTTDDGLLKWTIDRKALRKMRSQDGVLVLVTNSKTLTAEEVAQGYRTLWRVENAFRHMKGDIGLRPIRHWNDRRVLGHVCVCVLAYLIECVYDRHLQDAGLTVSTHTALDQLSKIITATLVCEDQKLCRRSEITPDQRKLLAAAGVTKVPDFW